MTQTRTMRNEEAVPLPGEKTPEEELERLVSKYDDCCKRCHAHIREYCAQKALLKEYVKTAKEDKANNVPLEDRTIVLTEDMMQKATVLWLASEQVDVAYYFCPKTQHVSGWADYVYETMNCYI